MSLFLSLFLFLAVPPQAPPQGSGLNTLINGVDRNFARMRDFSADFVEIVQDSLNQKRQESGHLYLMAPRMMRWEYKDPEEKLFVSDGKTVFYYVPADRQVSKDAVGNTIDDRLPLGFLLKRSGLRKEFSRFELLNTPPFLPGDKVIRMYPLRKTDIQEIVIEVDPVDYVVRRFVFTKVDGERLEFVFSNIRTNTGLKQSLFNFTPPPGVQVLNGIGR